MKHCKEMLAKIAKATVEKALQRDANSTTCVFIYQPKAPQNLNRFKKSK